MNNRYLLVCLNDIVAFKISFLEYRLKTGERNPKLLFSPASPIADEQE